MAIPLRKYDPIALLLSKAAKAHSCIENKQKHHRDDKIPYTTSLNSFIGITTIPNKTLYGK